MKTSWFPTVPILAVLAVPFGLAVYEDAVHPERATSHSGGADRYGDYDDYDRLDDYDYGDGLSADSYDESDYAEAEVARQVMDPSFFDAVFFTGAGATEPHPSGVLDGARLGDPRIEDASSPLVRWSDFGETPFEGAGLHLEYSDNKLSEITVSFLGDEMVPSRFHSQWGEPDGIASEYGTQTRRWLDETRKISATLLSEESSATVSFARYLPLAELVRPEVRKAGVPLGDFQIVGAGRTAVLAKLRNLADATEVDEYSAYLSLPRTEYSDSATRISLSFDRNRVDSMEVGLNFALNADKRDTLIDLFARKLGKTPTVSEDEGTTVARFAGKPFVEIQMYGSTYITIRISND